MGGVGAEREISIQSGTCVAEALNQAGFDVVTSDITPDNLDILEADGIDVFFPALHGEFGEDGQLQQIFEARSLVYAGSGPAASKLAFDKIASKKAFAAAGVAVPAGVEFAGDADVTQLETKLKEFAAKYVVKPIRQGSSVGVRIVSGVAEAIAAAQETLSDFGDCMIEEFIAGREITVGVLCGRALPIIEIRPKEGFYDYHAKYIDDATEYVCSPIDDASLARSIQAAAMDCFEALGCGDFGRVDFILNPAGTACALEINTIPGFTSHSLLPKAAAEMGLSMSDLCEKIVAAAVSGAAKMSASVQAENRDAEHT